MKVSMTLAAALVCAAGLATPALTQTSTADYARTGGGGLLLNNMELKQSPEGSRENAVGMNGHVLIFQADYNLCLKTSPDLAYRWCLNDEAKTTWMNTRKVVFVNGTLKALDGAGKTVWKSTAKADPYAKLIITPEGKLVTMNASGAVYWSRP